jgi:capsular polysaccharide biosynthesis protein
MIGSSWRIEDPEPFGVPTGAAPGNLVSFHFLRSAVRRHWKLIAGSTLAGLLLGAASIVLMPAPSTASAAVLLAHQSGQDPLTAIATDGSLLKTRAVSQRVVTSLGLHMTADAFRSSFTSTPQSTEILEIELAAPNSRDAVRRLDALCGAFLAFRNDVLERQANSVIDEDTRHMDDLSGQLRLVNTQLEVAGRDGDEDRQSALLNQQNALSSQITALNQTIQDAQIQTAAVATATHVVDSAAPGVPETKRRIAFALASGMIGGFALGAGLVIAHALVTNRLRRREDIATALGKVVRVSAGQVHTLIPWRRRGCQRNLEVLASGLAASLEPGGNGRQQLAVLGVGDVRAAARVVLATADDATRGGLSTFLVDLTTSGVLTRLNGSRFPAYQPEGRAELSRGPLTLVASSDPAFYDDDRHLAAGQSADLVLILGEIELGVGAGPLSTWADKVVVLVRAGRVTAEYLRTTARMLHASGPEVAYAMVVGSDASDESGGVPRQASREQQRRVP